MTTTSRLRFIPSADGPPPDVVFERPSRAPRELVAENDALRHQVENLKTALKTSRRIGISIGILMARCACTDEQAFDLLRHNSQATNRKLREVAEDVIYAGWLPG